MKFVQNVLLAIKFISIATDTILQFLIYKYFKKNYIKQNEEDVNGKCVVVTGGSSGIGNSSAKEFARRGAIVVIGDVDLENGQKAVNEIQRETGNFNVTILKLDLSDMDSVEQFANQISVRHPKIKILLNNAGIGHSEDENIKTKDGFNVHVAVNFLGHFLLTCLLMDNLKAETKPRIVSTSSTMQLLSQLDIDDINMDQSGFGLLNYLPYSNTKFCLALFTRQLAKHNGINAYALCPGIVKTPIYDHIPKLGKLVFIVGLKFFSSTANEAASEFIMYCALEKSIENETGKMYRFRKHFRNVNKKLDSDLARKLFEKSAKLVKLNERLARMK